MCAMILRKTPLTFADAVDAVDATNAAGSSPGAGGQKQHHFKLSLRIAQADARFGRLDPQACKVSEVTHHGAVQTRPR